VSLAEDIKAPPLARRVAEIIKGHAARLELGPDWADAAALRVMVEVEREAEREATMAMYNGEAHTAAPPSEADTGLRAQFEVSRRRLAQMPAAYR
jgi:hypothetical protein